MAVRELSGKPNPKLVVVCIHILGATGSGGEQEG
jgi:hypothetical protein